MTTAHFYLLTREDILGILKISEGTLAKFLTDKVLPDGRPLPNGWQLYWRSDEFWEAVNRHLSYRTPTTAKAPMPPASSSTQAALEPTKEVSALSNDRRRPARSRPIMSGSATAQARRCTEEQLARMNAFEYDKTSLRYEDLGQDL
jgi:hypothetical protein